LPFTWGILSPRNCAAGTDNNRVETPLDSGTIVGRQDACAVITDTPLTLAADRALNRISNDTTHDARHTTRDSGAISIGSAMSDKQWR